MVMEILPERKFLDMNLQLFDLRLLALLTAFVNFLVVFIITHVNTREKRGFKALIVAVQVSTAAMSMHVCLFMSPTSLYPLPAFYTGGLLSAAGVTPHAQLSFLVFLIATWMMCAIFVIAYRNQIVVYGTTTETGQTSLCLRPHPAIICYVLVVGPLTALWVFSRTDQVKAREKLAENFDHWVGLSSVDDIEVYLPDREDIIRYAVLISVATGALGVTLATLLTHASFHRLRQLRLFMMERSFRRLHQSTVGYTAHAVVPMAFFWIPLMAAYMAIHYQHDSAQVVANIAVCAMATHSCVAGVALIYLVPYYRRAVLRALRKTKAMVLLKYSEYSAKPSRLATPAEPALPRYVLPHTPSPQPATFRRPQNIPRISISFVH